MDYTENLLRELAELRNKKQSEKELPSMRCATVHPPQVLPDFCTPDVPISTLDTSIKERERSLLSFEEKLKTKSPSLPKDIKENISPELQSTLSDKDKSCTLSYSDDILKEVEFVKQNTNICVNFLQNIENEYAHFLNSYYKILLYLIYTRKERVNFNLFRDKMPVSTSSVGKTFKDSILGIISDIEKGKIEIIYRDRDATLVQSRLVQDIRGRQVQAKNQMYNLIHSVEGVKNLSQNIENLITSELKYIPSRVSEYSSYDYHDPGYLILSEEYLKIQTFLQRLDITFYTLNPDKVKEDLLKRIKKIPMCGVIPEFPDTPSLPDIKPNYSNLGLSSYSSSDISRLPYWVQFSIGLNAIAVQPKYWTVGLIIGTKRIKLPIVWIPLVCIPTPVCIFVLWLTINGIVVFPVLYTLKFFPLGDSDSELTTLFKGGKQLIKTKTTSKSFNLPILGGIDVNPEVSSKTPYNIDDLPIQERLGLGNPPHVEFLNKWCSTAKPYMGL